MAEKNRTQGHEREGLHRQAGTKEKACGEVGAAQPFAYLPANFARVERTLPSAAFVLAFDSGFSGCPGSSTPQASRYPSHLYRSGCRGLSGKSVKAFFCFPRKSTVAGIKYHTSSGIT